MSLELIIAGVLMTTLTGYVLTGVADFGAGAWYLAARGGRAPAQRAFIDRALAPIWEANHVWLIVVLVGLHSDHDEPSYSAHLAADRHRAARRFLRVSAF